MSHKIFVVGDNQQVRQMFNKRPGYIVVGNISNADAIVYTGGADICPYLYGERPIMDGNRPLVNFNPERDLAELALYRKLDWGMPKIGICRGAQLLNVLAGGSMWQDVDNHLGNHEIRIFDDEKRTSYKLVNVSSTHHQMMIPTDDAVIIGVGTQSSTRKRENQIQNIAKESWVDPEIIYNWTNNSLCFQPHPEYGPDECTHEFFRLVESTFFSKKQKAN